MSTACNTNSGEAKVITFRLTRGQADRLRVAAEAEHRTVSQELRRLVDQHLDGLERAA